MCSGTDLPCRRRCFAPSSNAVISKDGNRRVAFWRSSWRSSLVWLFWAQGQWVAFTLALFLHGTVGSFFSGTTLHELGHGTVFWTKALNKIFLYIFSVLSW
jgi:fatty acid desaturase